MTIVKSRKSGFDPNSCADKRQYKISIRNYSLIDVKGVRQIVSHFLIFLNLGLFKTHLRVRV